MAIDVLAGTERVVARPAAPYPITRENGRSALRAQDGAVLVDGMTVSPAGVPAERVSFSPDGSYLSVDGDGEMSVFDLESDRRVPVTVPDAAVTVVDWLDDQHLVVLARPRATMRYELMTCGVTTQGCETVEGTLTPGFQLPTGERVDWG